MSYISLALRDNFCPSPIHFTIYNQQQGLVLSKSYEADCREFSHNQYKKVTMALWSGWQNGETGKSILNLLSHVI